MTKQAVAVIGSGAVGSYYGARLWETGQFDVLFQMRGEHYDTSVAKGLRIDSVHGDINIPPADLQAFKDTNDMGKVDWVIVALKSTALETIPSLIFPLLEPGRTRVLLLMNGLVEEDVIRSLKLYAGEPTDNSNLQCCEALYGGMAFVFSTRIGPGHIEQTFGGTLTAGLAAQSLSTNEEESKIALENLWKSSKVSMTYEPSILRGRWKKNCFNVPLNGISVAMGGITVDKIAKDPGLRHLASLVVDEVIATANADMDRHGLDSSYHLGEADKKTVFEVCDRMGDFRTSTTLDFDERRPMEVKYLFRKPVDIAKEVGVPVPHLEMLAIQIEAFQRFYNLF